MKYGNAAIFEKNNEIVINAITEELKTYLANIQINSEKRQENILLHLNDLSHLDSYAFQGLATIFYLNIKPRIEDYSDDEKAEIEFYSNQNLFGIELKKWIKYLIWLVIKATSLKVNSDRNFIKLPTCDFLNDSELRIMVEKLTFSRSEKKSVDLFDKPIIYGKYLYLPSIIHLDPVYVVSILMREDQAKNVSINGQNKMWKDIIGYSLEKYYYKLFIKNNYECQHTVKHKNGQETDILVKDKDDIPVLIECKSFRNPHSLKDYIIQIDKMYSSAYLRHDSEHISYFKNVGIKNSKDSAFKGKMNGLKKWRYSYGIFLSNIIFPSNYCKIWNRETNLFFIYDNDMYKLINDKPCYNILPCSSVSYKPCYALLKDPTRILSNDKCTSDIICLVPRSNQMFSIYFKASKIDNFQPDQSGLDKYNIIRIFKTIPSLSLELEENISLITKIIVKEYPTFNKIECLVKLSKENNGIKLDEWQCKSIDV